MADSAISAFIWTDSVDTGIKRRDGHLRADNVFATARFPTLEFRSTAIVETPTGLEVTGTLRVRDVSAGKVWTLPRSTSYNQRFYFVVDKANTVTVTESTTGMLRIANSIAGNSTTTPAASAEATTASIALPPAARISAPASLER